MTDGQGKENRFSGDATIGANLDDLLNVFGVTKSLGNELKTFPVVFQYIMDAKGIGETVKGKDNSGSKLPRRLKVAVVSICNSCSDKPHGLPYRMFDEDRSVIDTINANKPTMVKKQHCTKNLLINNWLLINSENPEFWCPEPSLVCISIISIRQTK